VKVTKSKYSDKLNCILINYADRNFTQSQQLNTKTGIKVGKFKEVWSYSPKDISKSFYQANKELLNQKRGNGYWLWKPYFILKSLEKLDFGDYLFYCDSGAEFVDSVEPLLSLSTSKSQEIMTFELVHPEYKYTKRDVFKILDCDNQSFIESKQRLASYILFRKSARVINFANEWLHYCTDERLITDSPNVFGLNNFEGFVDHRHDQSIFSLLAKKYQLEPFRDPSQYGSTLIDQYSNSPYNQLINSTRLKNKKLGFTKTLSDVFKKRVWK